MEQRRKNVWLMEFVFFLLFGSAFAFSDYYCAFLRTHEGKQHSHPDVTDGKCIMRTRDEIVNHSYIFNTFIVKF